MNIQQKLGNAIKEVRTAKNISQERFALSIDMDRTYFASVEAGKRNISIQNIEKIAKGLNLKISDLLSIAETKE